MTLKEKKSLKTRYAELNESLIQIQKEAEYYKNIAAETGRIRLREVDRLSRLISERKKAEIALREGEELLRATVESTADGILVVDENGQVTYTNRRYAQMWQIPDELIRTGEERKLLDFVLGQLKEPEVFLSKVQRLYKTSDEDIDVLDFRDGRVFERFSSPLIRDGQIAGRVWSFRDITDRKEMEEKLLIAHEKLERRVEERTAELLAANAQLKQEVIERETTQKELEKREQKLELQTRKLEEINTALKVILEKRNEDKLEIEERVLLNINEMILPYIEKLRKSLLNELHQSYVDILESNLNEITSPFYQRMASNFYHLTPKEIQIAGLIKQGKTTKEIAELLQSSSRAIEFHRNNLRKKFGLKNKKTNLMTHLLTLN